jgi:predicted Fe-Mo cluster-binding NifX family protein
MKIAVTTSDGFYVDENFGRSPSFYIFNITGKEVNFLETRSKRQNSNCDAFQIIYNLIKDCNAVFSANIEDLTLKKLKNKGIVPIIYQGEINNLNIT